MMHFTGSSGLRLAYRDEGEGLPVLCLAGLTRNMTDFDDVAAEIGAECRLIAMDYRGRGASDWAATPDLYSVPAEAGDALELLDHLGLERVVVLGTSRGGIIAMMLAAMAKDRLRGVILNDIGPEIADEGLQAIAGYVGVAPKADTYDGAAEAVASRVAAQFPGVPLSRWRVSVERWFREEPEGGLTLRYDPALREPFLAALEQPAPDLWPLFDLLDGVPLGLIRGANSDLLTPQTAAEMQRRRPDMHFANVPDRGHVPFLDEPDALAVIRACLKDAS